MIEPTDWLSLSKTLLILFWIIFFVSPAVCLGYLSCRKCVHMVIGLCIIHYSANDLNCSHTRWAKTDPEHDRVGRKTSMLDGIGAFAWKSCLQTRLTEFWPISKIFAFSDKITISDFIQSHIKSPFHTSTEPRHDFAACCARCFIRKWNETLKRRRRFWSYFCKLHPSSFGSFIISKTAAPCLWSSDFSSSQRRPVRCSVTVA